MARKKRRKKSRAKSKKKQEKALDVTIASEVSGEIKVKDEHTKKTEEPRGLVSGELKSVISGEIVIAPEKALDVTFDSKSQGIIIEDGVEVIDDKKKVVGEITVDSLQGFFNEISSGGIEISGEGVIEETPFSEMPTPVPQEDLEALPTQPIQDQIPANNDIEQQNILPSDTGTNVKGIEQENSNSDTDQQKNASKKDNDSQQLYDNTKNNSYILSEEEHKKLLQRRDEQVRKKAKLLHSFPSPFSIVEELRSMEKTEIDPTKFVATQEAEPAKELRIESLRDLIPKKTVVSEKLVEDKQKNQSKQINTEDIRQEKQDDITKLEHKDAKKSMPEKKQRSSRKRHPSGSMTIDAAFTDAEKAFFEEDLENEEELKAIQELFDSMGEDAKRGWLDSLKDLIAPTSGKKSKKVGGKKKSSYNKKKNNSSKPKKNK